VKFKEATPRPATLAGAAAVAAALWIAFIVLLLAGAFSG
jgi:hypothetical protein